MKVFVVLAATLAVGLAAPTNTVVYGAKRSKKSTCGAPCGGESNALYLAPQAPRPQGPHYRENDAMVDTESHEHRSSRSYNEAGSPLAGLAAASAGGPSSGPAFGVFPNANLGGCATPLLLSCSPKVVSGHILKHTSYAHPVAIHAPAYREAEMTHDMEMNMKEAGMEKSRAEHHENFHHSPVAQDHHKHVEAMQHNMAHQSSSHQGNSLQPTHNLGQTTKL